jgi:hypothetical protein
MQRLRCLKRINPMYSYSYKIAGEMFKPEAGKLIGENEQ